MPFAAPIDATEAFDRVHVPPAGVLVSVCVVPTHIDAAPAIDEGVVNTDCVRVTKHPETVLV
mgnify:CR=1 FL=1